MSFSPLDVRQQNFRSALRGFDRGDVTAFLMEVAEHYEQALKEADRLRHELARAETALNEHRERERTLASTLMAAQKLADDIKAAAEEEARGIVREAQDRSDRLLAKAHARIEDVQREIDGLQLKRKEVESSLEATIQALRDTLEYVREQEPHDRADGKTASHLIPDP